mgnify:FL=1
MPTTDLTPDLHVGQFVQDGRAEAEIVEISPDGMEVVIQYTDTHETIRLMRNRFQRADGELHAV